MSKPRIRHSFDLECNGENHSILVLASGKFAFPDHENIEDEIVSNEMGNNCACARLLQKYRGSEYFSDGGSVLDELLRLRLVQGMGRHVPTDAYDPLGSDSVTFDDYAYFGHHYYVSYIRYRTAQRIATYKLQSTKFGRHSVCFLGDNHRVYLSGSVVVPWNWLDVVYRQGLAVVDGYFVLDVEPYPSSSICKLVVQGFCGGGSSAVCVYAERGDSGQWRLNRATLAESDAAWEARASQSRSGAVQ